MIIAKLTRSPHSGVLVESLQRSKQKWLSEGIFERYWTKPTKKKGQAPEPPNNPSKDSMTKLGNCTITVEPHIFEAVMYAIKDPNPKPVLPAVSQQPMYRPIIQYGPPNGVMPPPPPPPAAVQQKQFPPTQPIPQTSPRSHDPPSKTSVSAIPANKMYPPAPMSHLNGMPPNGQSPSNPAPSFQQSSPAPSTAAPPPATGQKSTDPVIQMLAERAATDPDLKALMRIVANGEATPEELKKFQTHIDELTRLQKARQAATQAANPPPPPQNQPPPPAPPSPVNGHVNGLAAQTPKPSSAPARTAPTPPAATPPPAPRPEPQYQPQPQALRSKGPLPPTKPDISGIVFEFIGGSGDRFLFPKFSIIEYLPQGGQVIASFLIVRKGSSSDSPTYDPALDYYQPITIRLWSHQGRALEALQKVVAPPEEVRRYMDDIMDNMTRAEYVLLAMRLPKDAEQASTEKEDDTEMTDRVDNNQVLWGTTNATPIAKVKPAKKLVTEEEQYQSFITTVS